MLTELYTWIVYVHVSAAFGFVLAHGVAVFAGFRIRAERERPRIAAMLDLSAASRGLMYASLVILVVAGLTAGAMGGWLGHLWIWTSMGVLVGVAVAMGRLASSHYLHIRQLVGAAIPPREAGLAPPSKSESVEEQLAARLRSRIPEMLAAIGGGGLLIVIWLMLAKPF